MNRPGTEAERLSKETRRLEELGDLSDLSLEATRLLPLEETLQPGQSALANDAAPPTVGLSPTGDLRAESPGRRLALNTLIVGGAFIISRVLGLVREAVIAGQFGTTNITDDYVRAFRVPDTLFLLIIGGAVGSAFIPVFTGLMGKGEEQKAWRLASTLINASLVLMSIGIIAMSLLAPAAIGSIIAPKQSPADQALVVDLTRIMLLSPLFLGLGGWAMGILNARQHFTLPALAPIAYNLAIIGGALFLVPSMGVYGIAWGVVIGALLHFGVQVPGLLKAGMRYSFRLNLRDSGVKEVGRLLLPRIIGQAAFQANIVGATFIASAFAGGLLAAFNNAYQLMILPHGVFAMSIATTTFPTMAAQFAVGDLEGVRSTLARGIRVLLFLILPSAVGLFVLRTELVASLFQAGQFKGYSTLWVASALGYFAVGLTAYAVVEVLTRGFYALHDTATPVIVAVATVVMNLALSGALVFGLGWSNNGQDALAFSLALTTTIEMALLWLFLGRKLPGWRLTNDGLLQSTTRSALAALIMGVVLFALMSFLENSFHPTSSKLAALALTAIGVTVGGATYAGAARLLRSEELGEAVRLALRRKT